MSNQADELEEDDIPETDFSDGVRGKYYERASQGSSAPPSPHETKSSVTALLDSGAVKDGPEHRAEKETR